MSNPQKPTDLGPNRTGAGLSPIDTKRMVEGAQKFSPDFPDGAMYDRMRLAVSKIAPPVGRVPPPPTVKGMAKTAVSAIAGTRPTVFIDKLAERLAFERTGARLYEALLVKFDASHNDVLNASRETLEGIRTDELRHAGILIEAIEHLGADPTAMTPCADITAVASMGLVQALTDARTTFTQGLDVILIAELADTESWTMLADLADALGYDTFAAQFRTAEEEERRHVEIIRGWLAGSILGQAQRKPTGATQPSAPAP